MAAAAYVAVPEPEDDDDGIVVSFRDPPRPRGRVAVLLGVVLVVVFGVASRREVTTSAAEGGVLVAAGPDKKEDDDLKHHGEDDDDDKKGGDDEGAWFDYLTFCKEAKGWDIFSGKFVVNATFEGEDCLLEATEPDFVNIYGGTTKYPSSSDIDIQIWQHRNASNYRNTMLFFRMQLWPEEDIRFTKMLQGYACNAYSDNTELVASTRDTVLYVYKMNGTDITHLAASDNFSYSINTWYLARAAFSGSKITCSFYDSDGELLAEVSANDDTFQEGYVGLGIYRADQGHTYWRSATIEPNPTFKPTSAPVPKPTPRPSDVPVPVPTPVPSSLPVPVPTPVPSDVPVPVPTPKPSSLPVPVPTPKPSSLPVPVPTPVPSDVPVPVPTPVPSDVPAPVPTPKPTSLPVPVPTPVPSSLPVPVPTPKPSSLPVPVPTPVPSSLPVPVPTPVPSSLPVPVPTPKPSDVPMPVPTTPPSKLPIPAPSSKPSSVPIPAPSKMPTTESPTTGAPTTKSPTTAAPTESCSSLLVYDGEDLSFSPVYGDWVLTSTNGPTYSGPVYYYDKGTILEKDDTKIRVARAMGNVSVSEFAWTGYFNSNNNHEYATQFWFKQSAPWVGYACEYIARGNNVGLYYYGPEERVVLAEATYLETFNTWTADVTDGPWIRYAIEVDDTTITCAFEGLVATHVTTYDLQYTFSASSPPSSAGYVSIGQEMSTTAADHKGGVAWTCMRITTSD